MASETIKRKKAKRKPKRDHIGSNFFYDFVKFTGAIPMLLKLRTKVIYVGKKPKVRGACLVSANHRGLIDPVIILTIFKMRRPIFLAAEVLYQKKWAARFFNALHFIKTDRHNFSISAFHNAVDRLKSGKMVVIFPEGRINDEDNTGVLPFKTGVAFIAHKANAPILPIYIIKRENERERQKVVVGEPINLRDYVGDTPSIDQLTNVSEILREKEFELRDYYEKNYLKKDKQNEEAEEVCQ